MKNSLLVHKHLIIRAEASRPPIPNTPNTPESGWLHISYNKDGNRKQKLRAFRNDAGKTQYEEI